MNETKSGVNFFYYNTKFIEILEADNEVCIKKDFKLQNYLLLFTLFDSSLDITYSRELKSSL